MKSHKPQTNVLPIIVRSIANGATRVCHLDILHRTIKFDKKGRNENDVLSVAKSNRL